MKLTKVLIIDDSALVRQTLTSIINSAEGLSVIGTAADPYFAAQKIKASIPDVITLDIEMPRMDGLTFLKSLMAQYPIPVVIISSLTQRGSELALRALSAGAVEIVAKSEIRNTKEHLEETSGRLIEAIKAASLVSVKRIGINQRSLDAENVVAAKPKCEQSIYKTTDKVIAIGASTGGTEALRYLLKNIPANAPGILITQHMPAGFTRSFADHVNQLCEITVKEASHGEKVMRGHAYIAPGGRHMELQRSGAKYFISIRDGELVNRHRPSVDVLFDSVALNAGQNAVGIIMTGMGKDGARGLLNMRQRGARTIAQDERTSVIFGMPKEAIRINAAEKVFSLDEMPSRIIGYF
jgi:two-component system, chemotaxis family, protein-glutamate methylesterase/glutaminase